MNKMYHAVSSVLTVAQLLKIVGKPIQFMAGGRYYAEKPEGGPDWGLRLW